MARVEHREDMGVLQSCGEADLAEETLGAGHPELRAEHLQGDESFVSKVADEVDGRHAPAPELALECVATVQSIKEGWGCRHAVPFARDAIMCEPPPRNATTRT
jgi:hypothetical protein